MENRGGTISSARPKQQGSSGASDGFIGRAAGLYRKGKVKDAALALVEGLETDSECYEGHIALGDVCLELKQLSAAMEAYRNAVRIRPDNGDGWHGIAMVFRAADMAKECASALQEAIRRDPSHLAARLKQVQLFETSRMYQDALAAARYACAWHPTSLPAQAVRGRAARLAGRLEEAIEVLSRALDKSSADVNIRLELGVTLREARQYEHAEQVYLGAPESQRRDCRVQGNLANLYVEMLRLDEAERCFKEQIRCQPADARAHTHYAMMLLLSGRWREGWREYKWRTRMPGCTRLLPGIPEWQGQPIKGKRLLLLAEQGAGDTIQFARYAAVLREQGIEAAVRCHPSLRKLLTAVSDDESDPRPDFQCRLLDVPVLLETKPDNVPERRCIDAALERPPLPGKEGGARIGICWAGNPGHANDRNRSCRLEDLDPLMELAGATFFSFQVGASMQRVSASRLAQVLHPLADRFEDFADTAAHLKQMHAIVTVDTAVAHLAGALGVPTALLLPFSPDWRWLLDRPDTPWYESARLFRQTRAGDWSGPVREIVSWLQQQVRSTPNSIRGGNAENLV